MKWLSFQDGMDEAIRRCNGSQSELMRRVNLHFPHLRISAQTIQYLASRTRKPPARGSTITPQIAAVTGLSAKWLAAGHGDMDDKVEEKKVTGYSEVNIHLRPTSKLTRKELNKEAVEIARTWLALPHDRRDWYKHSLEREALGGHKKRSNER